jgi:hypothetical protein
MKIEATTIEKIFIPVLSAVIISGVTTLIQLHTKLEVLENKVNTNTDRIIRIFNKLEKISDDQKEILRLLFDWEHKAK